MKMNLLTTLVLGGSLLHPDAVQSQKSPLNILLFTADDLDRNSLGCYGSKVPDISPNIDHFAKEGIKFNHAFVNNSICAPSRGILATGLYGHNSGVMGFMKVFDNIEIPLIMELFREQGYRVGVLSKVDHSTPRESFEWDYTKYQADLGRGRSPSLYYERAVEFLQSCKESGKPFYFMVNSDDPHRPYFNPDGPLQGGMERPSRIYSPEEITVPGFLPDLPMVRKELSYYYNSAKRLDDTFGKVMKALEDCGLRENTLVIFMSDNGIAVPFAKCDNYYASNRTPFIARLPGVIQPGRVDDTHFISGVDYLPTILEAAGITPPERIDGESKWPAYLGQELNAENLVFTQIDSKAWGSPRPMRSQASPMRGVQNGEYLYIFNAWSNGKRIYYNNNEGLCMQAMESAAETDAFIAKRVQLFRYRVPEEFYDLRKDPDCLHNLMEDPAYAGKIKKMRKAMKTSMKKTGDPLLYSFKHRNKPEKTLPSLYEIYPELRDVDKGIVRQKPTDHMEE